MTEETRRKIYRAIARMDIFLMSCSTSLLCFAATVLLAISGRLAWRESRTAALLLWACSGITAAVGAIEWRQTGK